MPLSLWMQASPTPTLLFPGLASPMLSSPFSTAILPASFSSSGATSPRKNARLSTSPVTKSSNVPILPLFLPKLGSATNPSLASINFCVSLANHLLIGLSPLLLYHILLLYLHHHHHHHHHILLLYHHHHILLLYHHHHILLLYHLHHYHHHQQQSLLDPI